MNWIVSKRYRHPGLNFAAAEVAALVNRILYPIPGIWLSPACVHMPSGNAVVQLATPRGGPFDPVPVFTCAFLYDRADRLRTLITAEGHEYQYKYLFPETEYDVDYFVEVTDPAGHVTTVVHDCNVVNAVVNPLGERTTFVWECSGDSRLSAVVDANNHATTLSYTRLSSGVLALSGIARPEVCSMSFDYDSSNHCIQVTDYDGNATALTWDSDENRETVLNAETNLFTTTYNGHRQAEITIDPLTFRTTTVYDTAGNATSVANELNEIKALTYEATGDAETVTNPLTKVTTFTRDALGRVTAIGKPISAKGASHLTFNC